MNAALNSAPAVACLKCVNETELVGSVESLTSLDELCSGQYRCVCFYHISLTEAERCRQSASGHRYYLIMRFQLMKLIQ